MVGVEVDFGNVYFDYLLVVVGVVFGVELFVIGVFVVMEDVFDGLDGFFC